MEGTIRKILEIAVNAPSGHNYQPWKFRIEGPALSLFNVPERDTTIYNFLQRGSFVGHGALIENILIAASQYQYKGNVSLFPRGENNNCTATIIFESSSEFQKDNLFPYIQQRTTNRKPYQDILLEKMHQEEIFETAHEIGSGVKLYLVQDEARKKSLATAFSINERLLLESYEVHQSLFPHVIWSKQEEIEKRSGLYIKTFELPLLVESAFRLFKYWNIVKRIGKSGLSRSVAKKNADIYASASAIGLITVPNDSNTSFILAGRLLERIWLKATKLKISLQSVTAVLYLGQRVLAGDTERFSEDHTRLIRTAYNAIQNIFNVSSETMAMTFRIGYDGIPSAYSSKLPPLIEQ